MTTRIVIMANYITEKQGQKNSKDKINTTNISNNIKNLLLEKNNMFIKEIEKTEYGIYTLGYRFNLNVPNSLIF